VGLTVINFIDNFYHLVVIKRLLIHHGQLVDFISRYITAIRLHAVMRTRFTIAAFYARGQNIGQSELFLDLIDNLHITHDLKSLVVNDAILSRCLALCWGVGNLACETRVDPKVDQVCAQCCAK